MKRFLLIVCTLFIVSTAVAQNSRVVKGYVQTEDGTPLVGAIVISDYDKVETTSNETGYFEVRISPYSKSLSVKYEGYISESVEIESSYQVIRLKKDTKYEQNKALAAEQARIAEQKRAEAEAKAAEQARIEAKKQAEAKAKAKAEQDARIAEQKRAAIQAKAEQDARLAEQKLAALKAKAAEEARLAEQKRVEKEEQKRLAKIAADKRRTEYAKKQKGFGSIVDLSYKVGMDYPYPALGISYTAGYRFNNQTYLGVGVGANFNLESGQAKRYVNAVYPNNFLNPSLISMPAFLYFRTNLVNGRWSPFFAIAAGGDFASKQTLKLDLYEVQYSTIGAFANPQLGLNFRTTTTTSLYVAIGFQCFTAPVCSDFTGYNATIGSEFAYGFDFHFGITF